MIDRPSVLKYALVVLAAFLSAANTAFAQTGTAELHQKITQMVAQQGHVKWISQAVISADGRQVAWAADGEPGNSTHAIYYSPTASPDKAVRISAVGADKWVYETEPQFSPDGKSIAFFSDARGGQNQVFVKQIGIADSAKVLSKFDGFVSHLKWSPDGKFLSVLYVEKASREPSPMAAENRRVGVVDSLVNSDVQRIATINILTGETTQATPAGIYVFEYSWSWDSKQFAYSAAQPPGDDNWYIARIYKQDITGSNVKELYKPKLQIALPKFSPDGKQIVFIEGLMSDQGGIGGEMFLINADGGTPVNLTPNRKSSPSWFIWRPDGSIVFTEFAAGSTAINTLDVKTKATKRLWISDETIQSTSEETSIAVANKKGAPMMAFIRNSYSLLPDVWAGTADKIRRVTNLNTKVDIVLPKYQNVEWTNEGQKVQGWLLFPTDYNPGKKYPMLVMVHGGPAWIATPTWSTSDFNTTLFTQLGYFVFFPNARGSYGQGEKFTQANRRDWGFGDLRDIIAGVDTIVSKFPVDNNRLGMLGWSYGGFMSMFAPTQTNRFKAFVSGAGASDWLSYYGQNGIDKWMNSYFGVSPYDDPAPYVKLSPMAYIKQVKSPVLVLVGERDGECPAPQSFQYWHALKELGVPTQLVVYPDEGHAFNSQENMIDVTKRTIEWFNTHMPAR
jgi:dipeptidyl aminopeptidase/acylaminoacyl peptidase